MHAHAALFGRARSEPGGFVIEPSLLDTATGRTTSLPSLTVTETDLLQGLSSLPVAYARQLQPATTERVSERIARAAYPTRSLHAFELFARGQAEFRRGNAERAMDRIARALEIDPGFVIGQYALGVVHKSLGNRWKAAAPDMRCAR